MNLKTNKKVELSNRVLADWSKERENAFNSIKDALLTDRESNEIAEENEKEIDYDAKNEALDYKIRLEKRNSRKKWDRWLRRLVVMGFFMSYAMILLMGFGVITFNNGTLAVPSVVAAGVLQTYGLAKIAARYFFSDDKREKK